MTYQDELLSLPPFSWSVEQKQKIFSPCLKSAFRHHWENCPEFQFYCREQGFYAHKQPEKLFEYPYFPVSLFKTKKMISVPDENITARIMSSATSGKPSTIHVDAATARYQTTASTRILADYIGPHRRPFLVLDVDPSEVRSKDISARSAATRGFLIFAGSVEYVLVDKKDTFTVDIQRLMSRLREVEIDGKEINILGFTFILYHHVIRLLKDQQVRFKLPDTSKIIHLGGWKKLTSQKVSRQQFLDDIRLTLGVDSSRVYDFYGFTEQMGLVYGSRADHPKTVPLYAEIIIRDPLTLEPVRDGEKGLIQMLTPLPSSYPGISVLTDDIGRIVGRGQDRDGRWGAQFELIGRAHKAELRGCGDILGEMMG